MNQIGTSAEGITQKDARDVHQKAKELASEGMSREDLHEAVGEYIEKIRADAGLEKVDSTKWNV